MSSRPRHPDKDIEAAIVHAEDLGWTAKKRTGKTHAWDYFCVLTMIMPAEMGSFARSVYGQPLKILRTMQEI